MWSSPNFEKFGNYTRTVRYGLSGTIRYGTGTLYYVKTNLILVNKCFPLSLLRSKQRAKTGLVTCLNRTIEI